MVRAEVEVISALASLLFALDLGAGQPAFRNAVPLLFKWIIKEVGWPYYLLGTENCSGMGVVCTLHSFSIFFQSFAHFLKY